LGCHALHDVAQLPHAQVLEWNPRAAAGARRAPLVKGWGHGGGADLREVVCVCELTVAFEFLECVGKEKRVF
jgi:hypothetical protein